MRKIREEDITTTKYLLDSAYIEALYGNLSIILNKIDKMDKKIKALEKKTKGLVKDEKKLLKEDRKHDKVIEKAKKKMKGNC